MFRHAITLVFAVLLSAGIYVTVRPPVEADADEPTERLATVVRVAAVEHAPDHRVHTAWGVTRASDRTVLAFALPGRIVTRHVEVGDHVQEGDRIASLDDAPMRNEARAAAAAIDDLEAQRAQVERERERVERLIEAELGTGQALDQLETDARRIEAGIAAARARQAEANRMRDEAELRAPFDGVITDVLAESGQVVGAGTPIATLTGAEGAEVELGVPEAVQRRVVVGDTVNVRFPLSGAPDATGTVSHIARASGMGHLFPITVALPLGADVVPGMTAEVDLRLAEPAGIAVPVRAVLDPTGSGAAVFVVDGEVAVRVPVHVVRVTGELVVVDAPLNIGSTVVVAGVSRLSDGDQVEVAE